MITSIKQFKMLKESYNQDNFVGIHCSPNIHNDDFYGKIIDEYCSYFETILSTIKFDYDQAEIYLERIASLGEELNLHGDDDNIDLIFDIESFFEENNIEWIFVATEALTKYGENCYEVYFDNLDKVYSITDELVDNATIYIYDSSIIKPLLKQTENDY